MKHSWLGLIELFVVLMFAAGWGILELVALRLDRRAREDKQQSEAKSGHAEGQ